MKWLCLTLVLFASCQKSAPPAAEVFFEVDPATSGTIRGSVHFTGQPDAAVVIDMDQDPACQKLYASNPRKDQLIVVNPSGTLANVFVYLKTGLENKKFKVPDQPARIDQRGCWFEPRVVGVQTGQSFEVTNSDPVTHNIHPMPEINREWNQSMAPEDEPLRRRFARPEVMIRVKCNVHRWMRAWIGVVDHPYFATTGTGGGFEMAQVPPGDYTLVAWHEKLGLREQKINVPPGGTTELKLQFDGQ